MNELTVGIMAVVAQYEARREAGGGPPYVTEKIERLKARLREQ